MPAGRTGAAALVIGLLVSGCSQDPQPRIETAPSTPATSEPSATPRPSVVTESPSPAASPAEESAAQFIQRWFDASAAMQNSGNPVDYRAITSGCAPCSELARRVTGYYDAGGYVRFGGQRVLSTDKVPSSENLTVLRVQVKAEPTEYQRSSLATVQRIAGGQESLEVVLTGSPSEGWSVVDYLRVPT